MNKEKPSDGLVHCGKCGWVHFTVSLKYVRDLEAEWLHYFNTKDKEWLSHYGITDAPPSSDQYLECFRCGETHKSMLDGVGGKNIDGQTIQPTLDPKEDY